MILVLAALASEEPNFATAEGQAAEYQRLADALKGHAQRGQWGAVDRVLQRIDATGRPHTQEVRVVFAQSASRHGDLLETKSQLEAALKIEPHEEIRSWLTRIEHVYTPVFLAADLPANYRLNTSHMPFQLEERGAVEFAQQQILENSRFRGLLPKGSYTFTPYGKTEGEGVFELELRSSRRSIDLRTKDEPTAADRRRRAKIDRRTERDANPAR